MATRLYLPSSGTAAASPAYDASWNVTTSAVRRPLSFRPGSTSVSSLSLNETSATEVRSLGEQYVSDPLPAAVTLSGTFTHSTGSRSGTQGTAGATIAVVIRVVTSANVVRGTVFAGESTVVGENYPNIMTRLVTGTLTPLDCQAGDRIIIERGARFNNTTTVSQNLLYMQGDNVAVKDESAIYLGDSYVSNDRKPWFEFSQDAIWGPTIARVSTLPVAVMEVPARTATRIGAADVAVMEKPSRTPARLAATAVQVMIPRNGQRVGTIRSVSNEDSQVYRKLADGRWVVVEPVRKPTPPLPQLLAYPTYSVTSSVSVPTLPSLKVGDILVYVFVAGNAFATTAANASTPTPITGVTWQLAATDGTAGPQYIAWLGTVTQDAPTLPSTIGNGAGRTDNAAMLAVWRGPTRVVAAAMRSRATGPFNLVPAGVSFTPSRIAMLAVSGGTSISILPVNPAQGWLADTQGTSKFATGADPYGKSPGYIQVDVNANAGLPLSALLLVLE